MSDYTPVLFNPLWTGEQRLEAILSGTNGIIVFDSDRTYPGHESYSNPWYSIDGIGDDAVRQNSESIQKYSLEYGIDADLFNAIVYLENSHGWYDLGLGSSIRPGNVNVEIWGDLLGNDGLKDPRLNLGSGLIKSTI